MVIWLIEDNKLHSTFFKLICQELNVKYKIFNSSKEFLNFFENFNDSPPDAVFIDLILENGIRGDDLILKIKEKFPKSKFIAFTADILPQKSLLEKGFDKIVYKPVTKEKLFKVIQEITNAVSKS